VKQSMRARRMAKQHRRQGAQAKLNLVSLMDIFTIIVFFLLMSSSDIEVLQNQKTITLPESVSDQKPAATLVIMVDAQQLMIGREVIAKVDDEMSLASPTIESLTRALKNRAVAQLEQRSLSEGDLEGRGGLAVTIMGDKSVSYVLLKKIMATCAAADYRKISLAVSTVETGAPANQQNVMVREGV